MPDPYHQLTDLAAAGQVLRFGGVVEQGVIVRPVHRDITIVVVHVKIVPEVAQGIADTLGIAHQVEQGPEDPHALVQAELKAEQRVIAGFAGQFQHQCEAVEGNQRIRIVQHIPGQAGFAQKLGGVEVLAAGEFMEAVK
ncbi:hypothetical protein D3C84_967630 [compost metagenome]